MCHLRYASILAFVLYTVSSNAALYVRSDTACMASVHVEGKETYVEGASVLTVIRSVVADSQNCAGVQTGEQLNFAHPGGVVGEFETRVNGIALEVGEEVSVVLSNASTSLGIPYLVQTFPQTSTMSGTAAFRCERVPPKGPSLFWKNRVVVMHPAISYDARIPQDVIIEAMHWAADQWSGHPGSDMTIVIGEPTEQRWVGYDWSHKRRNYNIVTARRPTSNDFNSEWAHKANALAMTSITYIHRTGEIVDADVEINAHLYEFTDCESRSLFCLSRYDAKATLTHEFGHVIGFDHPQANEKTIRMTMYAESAPGETTKRWLSQDDIAGILFVYPKGQATPDCFGVERGEHSNFKIGLDQGGCSQTGGGRIWPIFLSFLLWALLQRRRLLR